MEDIRTSLFRKTGGFMKGICHPRGDCESLRNAGLGWIRRDVPYPFDADGNLSDSYRSFRDETRIYRENGLRSIVISPYPCEFLVHGIDPRTPEGLEKVREVCRFMAEDYRKLGVCWQATNEMFVIHFRMPLNIPESVEFLVASLRGLREGDPEGIIGHNTVSLEDGWDDLCREIDRRTECDYFGFDLYNGTWSNGGTDSYIERIHELYDLCGKPIVLMEFGFASLGGNAHADFREVNEYLAGLGFEGIDDLTARPDDFVKTLPPALRHTADNCAREDLIPALFNMMPHLTKLWFSEMVFPHTEEGQADFYAELLPKLTADPYLAGAIIYCWEDSSTCFTCGASDCPCETAWGITRCDGTKKPAYDVIREIFSRAE